MPSATGDTRATMREGMWRLAGGQAHDHVRATGGSRSVREFAKLAIAHVDRNIEWNAKGIGETGVEARSGSLTRGRSCPPPSPSLKFLHDLAGELRVFPACAWEKCVLQCCRM